MAYTQAQIEERISTLEAGLVLVEAGTTFADRGITYKRPADLQIQIGYWQRKLAALLGRARQTLIVASRGFH